MKHLQLKDYFLTQEEFEITETQIPGVLKTLPEPKDLGKYYDSKNYISHNQDSKSFKEKIYKYFQKINLNYKRNLLTAVLFQNAKVLDYGCGTGDFLEFCKDDFQMIGFEPNEKAREIAIQKANSAQFISDIEALENSSLDAITLWHVFEHLKNPEEMLEIFKNKLKDSGQMIIALPNYKSYDAKFYGKYWAAYDVPRHLFHYSQEGMQNILSQKNLKITKIKPLHFDAFYVSILSEKYRKNPFFPLFGMTIGAISNFKAVKSGEFSSLIYFIEKK